jgi:hypothetical protein
MLAFFAGICHQCLVATLEPEDPRSRPMRDLTTALQELYRHKIDCRVESHRNRGFRIILSDARTDDVTSFKVSADELPGAGDRLRNLARGLSARVAAQDATDKQVVPLSRVIARAVPASLLSVTGTPAPLMDVDVLSYAVLDATGQFETVWYANARGEVREEVLARREGWRQSGRFRNAEERSAADFCRLFVD